MRKVLRVTYYAGIIILFVLIAVAGFTQTNVFRSYLHSFIVDGVARETRGVIILGEIQGNLITGFRVDKAELRESGQPFFSADRLEFRYDPLGFILQRVSLARISIENPKLRIVRSSDGSWNINRFLKPTPPDSSTSRWVVDLKHLEIVNGTFTLVDSTQATVPSVDSPGLVKNEFNFHNLALSSLNLEAAARIGGRVTSFHIHQLSFRSAHPQFGLEMLRGEFSFSPRQGRLSKLDIVTNLSHVSVDAEINNANLLKVRDLGELKDVPIKLNLKADQLDLKELRMFVGSSIGFLDRKISGEVRAGGTLGFLKVETVTLHTPKSLIRIQGNVSNLHRPHDLELNLTATNNRFDPEDVLEYLPGLKLPNLRQLGIINFDLLFRGKPTAFRTRFVGISNAGSIMLEGGLDTREQTLSYDATVRTSQLNMGLILQDERFASSLNGTVSLKGIGTHVKSMTGLLRVEIDSSEFNGLPIRQSVVVLDVNDRVIRPRLLANWGLTRFDVSGSISMRRDDSLSYKLVGRVNSLNLASMLKSKSYESDLSFDIESQGTGASVNDLRGSLDVVFLHSSYGDHQFQKGTIHADLKPANGKRGEFHLTSDVADIDITGRFTLNAFVSMVDQGARLLYHALDHRFSTLDSLRAFSPQAGRPAVFQTALLKEPPPLDVSYRLNLKDLSPIGVFFGKDLEGSLSWNGSINSLSTDVRWQGEADINYVRFADQDRSLGLEKTRLQYFIGGLSASRVLDSLDATVNLSSSRLDFDSLSFAGLQIGLTLNGDSSTYSVSTLIDSTVSIEVQGSSRYNSGLISLNLPQCRVGINNYALENIDPVQIGIGRDGFHIQNLWMRHEVEEFTASGYFNPAGVSDVRMTLRNFVLNNVRNFARQAPAAGTVLDFGGMVHAEGQFRGSFDHPNLTLTANAVGVRYRETVFGQIVVRLSYFERLLNVFTEFRSRPEDPGIPPDLLVNGSVPYDFSFSGAKAQKLEGQMDLEIRTKGFRLEFLNPFLPELRNLTGMMICDMKMKGTVESPAYEGSMTLQGARFLFEPMNMQFIVDGQFVPSERQIALHNVTIKNIPQDRPDGSVNLSGTFTLEGLRIKDFDLQADGQLMIMKENARRSGQTFFGDLLGATGPSGLRWHGSPAKSYLGGRVLVKYANLTFPPTREPHDLPTRRIPVTLVLDTVWQRQAALAERLSPDRDLTLNGGRSILEGNQSSPLDTSRIRLPATPSAPAGRIETIAPARESFLDRIVYDLSIETQGATQVRFVFNNLTNEELFADLKGGAVFTKEGNQTRLRGEVEVGSRSYYNFLKKLDASGKIMFTGEPLNPELNIVARYEGTHEGRDTTGASQQASNRSSGSTVSQIGQQKVVVTLTITGTREKPEVKTELKLYAANGSELPTGPDAEADALSFLLTGQFRDDLTQQERRSLIGGNMLYGFTSSVLSGPLTDLLRKEFGVIRSVDVLYYGGSFQEAADVRLTGELGDAVIRLGGKVFNDINNTNVSIQLPMSGLLGSERWRNLVLELERRVEGVESIEQRRELKGVKVLYRIVF